mgnify:CR=1 FL=1
MSENETWKNVGKRVRWLRRTHGLTIHQLARGCGLSANAISLVERGVNAPSVAGLEKFAKVLKVEVRELFTFEGKQR